MYLEKMHAKKSGISPAPVTSSVLPGRSESVNDAGEF